MTKEITGIVKFWLEDKGWGALSSDALPTGQDAFAHFSAIASSPESSSGEHRTLHEGQPVRFRVNECVQDSFRYCAEDVRPLST